MLACNAKRYYWLKSYKWTNRVILNHNYVYMYVGPQSSGQHSKFTEHIKTPGQLEVDGQR